MDVILTGNDGIKRNITNVITSITLSGEYRSCCRSLNFGFIKSQSDKNTWTTGINLGDKVEVVHDGKSLFFGIVWNRRKSTDGNEIDITCKDFGIYLKKNKGTYNFKSITPESAVKKICSDFGISVGEIAVTGAPVSRKFIGASLYDIIMTLYTLAGNKKYHCIFTGEKLNVLVKGIVQSKDLTSGMNLLKMDVTESLDSMVNKIQVYGKDDTVIYTNSNAFQMQKYGLLNDIMRVTDSKSDYKMQADKKLNGIERKITVTNFGDVNYITGRSVLVSEPYHGLKGLFYIDADEHNFKNGIYQNKLTLNFVNMMDEKTGGSEET